VSSFPVPVFSYILSQPFQSSVAGSQLSLLSQADRHPGMKMISDDGHPRHLLRLLLTFQNMKRRCCMCHLVVYSK
jgi:hypothetical protein